MIAALGAPDPFAGFAPGQLTSFDPSQIDPLTGQSYADETPAQVAAAVNEFYGATTESPAGSKWQFVGAWTSGAGDPLAGLSAQNVISRLSAAVQPDFSVIASTPNPAYQILSGSIQVSLVDNTGHAKISDGQSVIQNAFAKIVGYGNVQSNTAQMISIPTGVSPSSPSGTGTFAPGASNPAHSGNPNPQPPSSWIEQHWEELLLAGGAIVVAAIIAGSFRR